MSREVKRLEAAGILCSRDVGRTKLVSANQEGDQLELGAGREFRAPMRRDFADRPDWYVFVPDQGRLRSRQIEGDAIVYVDGSPGNCGAGGYYTDGEAYEQAFAVGQRNGTWDKAQIIPGLAAMSLHA